MRKIIISVAMSGVLAVLGGCNNPTKSMKGMDSAEMADWALAPFVKQDKVNPILVPGTGRFHDPIRGIEVAWEEKDVFNPAVAVRGDSLFLLYRAQDKIGHPAGTSRIGLA
ncbi:MAG TPA: hypothetical protein VG605_21705, partial [Puia sp.]|nr:hypothetical protein [Puia sp.]